VFNIDIRQISDKNFSLENAIIAIVEFQGDIEAEATEIPNARVFVLGKNRAVLAVTGNFQEVVNKLSHIVNFVYPNLVYTLCQTSPLEASNADLFHKSPYLQLDGEGVIIGIVDSGIDYLNEEFINEDGTSRIIAIFDQTQLQGPSPEGQPVGREYLKDDINKAIQEKRAGKDPYAAVPVKDEIGHGTSMASIAGARGVDATVTGIAPKCSLAIVKLMAAESSLKNDYGVFGNAPVYSAPALYLGIKYLFDLSSKLKTPIVILVPLGSSMGPKTGQSIVESYIDEISGIRGITAVVPTGNQGNTEIHTSGILPHVSDVSDIELKIDKIQRDIKFEIWVSKPNKSSLSIISPTGETYDRILFKDNVVTEVNFLYEGTKFYILYNLPYVKTGDEKILITGRNMREGIWIFRLTSEYGENTRYDAYLVQRELLAPETKFLKPDPYITLTTPSTAQLAITVASYNQNNNANVSESGKGYTRTGQIKPDIAAGGVRALAVVPGGGKQAVSGTSVAAAVVAGCCALIFEWARVEGNDPTIYAAKMKTYLIRGATKRSGDVYPNPDWGYGTVNMKGVFDNIRSRLLREKATKTNKYQYYAGNLFVRLPE